MLAFALVGAIMTGPAAAEPAVPQGPTFHDGFTGMQLVDQDGRAWAAKQLLGQPVLFNFIFTACQSACPLQTRALAQLQRKMSPALRQRAQLVSVSLDPHTDTPKTLKAYAKRFHAGFDNWSFVTGRPDDIRRLAETLWLFRDGNGDAPLADHATSLWLVDAQGVLKVRYGGNSPDLARLERDLGELAPPTMANNPPVP